MEITLKKIEPWAKVECDYTLTINKEMCKNKAIYGFKKQGEKNNLDYCLDHTKEALEDCS